MKSALTFIGARLKFAITAEFELINRLSCGIPGAGLGLSLFPISAIGWLVLLAFGITPLDYPILGGLLSLLIGPAFLMLLFFGIAILLSAVPQKAVIPVCAKQSVVDSRTYYG